MMATSRQRIHKIWRKLEEVSPALVQLTNELNEILEDARNGEQVEILWTETGVIDVLQETFDLLQQIQQNPKVGIGGVSTHYSVQLRVNEIDELSSKVEEILNDGLEEGREREP